MMWLWYAYELDAAANGGIPTTIAVGCQPASNNGRCYFKDLAQWVQLKSRKNPAGVPVPDVGVGTDLTPDITDTANKLRAAKYNGNWDRAKLLPASRLSGLGTTFGALFTAIHNSVQDIRGTLERPLTADLQDMEDRLKLAMQGVHEMRIADMAISNAGAFYTELEGFLGYTLIKKTPQRLAIDGTTLYDELDHDANEAAHPGYKAAYAGFLAKCEDPNIRTNDNSFFKKYRDILGHHNAIIASQAIESALHEFRTPTGDLCVLPV
jgi:hypothetical protein